MSTSAQALASLLSVLCPLFAEYSMVPIDHIADI